MSIPINNNTDQFPDVYQQVSFGDGETPTGEKLTTISSAATDQFILSSVGMGNTFIHGIPNIAAALGAGTSNGSWVGTFANLTPVSPAGSYTATVPAIFTPSNVYLNQLQCTVTPYTAPSASSQTGWQINLAGNLLSSHHLSTDNNYIFNVIIAAVVGGVITDIYYGTFTSGGYVTRPTSVTTFYTDLTVDLHTASSGTYIILASNTSIVDGLVQAITNTGNLNFANNSAMAGPVLNFPSTATAQPTDSQIIRESTGNNLGLATVTDEINNIENKLFTIRWNLGVTAATGILSGNSITWTITGASAPTAPTNYNNLWSGFPNPNMMSQYIATGAVTPIVSGAVESFAVYNGAPLMQTTSIPAVTSPVTIQAISNGIIVSMQASDLYYLLNVAPTATFNIFFPVQVPYRLLQSYNMNYTSEKNNITELFANVIGSQYTFNATTNAVTGTNYPNTIANRLDADEAILTEEGAILESVKSLVVPNGSFELTNSPGVPAYWYGLTTESGPAFPNSTVGYNTITSSVNYISGQALALNTGGAVPLWQAQIPYLTTASMTVRTNTIGSATSSNGATYAIHGNKYLDINVGSNPGTLGLNAANTGSGAYSVTIGEGPSSPGGSPIPGYIPISSTETYYLKFKTVASTAQMIASITVNFFIDANTPSAITPSGILWSQSTISGSYPTIGGTGWASFYGIIPGSGNSSIAAPAVGVGVLNNGGPNLSIPSDARLMTITINAGAVGNTNLVNAHVYFDDIDLFVPKGKSGITLSFPSSGTFTTPSNCTEVEVLVIAGAGGGASGDTENGHGACSGGGGGGGAVVRALLPVLPESVYTVSVGGAGGGGPLGPGAGGNGGDSWIKDPYGNYVVHCTGGAGASAPDASSNLASNGGAGGSITTAPNIMLLEVALSGGAGTNGTFQTGDYNYGKAGGQTPNDATFLSTYVYSQGGNGGTGGVVSTGSGNTAGSAGTAGAVYVAF